MKTWHWTVIAAGLVSFWLALMVYMSMEVYHDKDPQRIPDASLDKPAE